MHYYNFLLQRDIKESIREREMKQIELNKDTDNDMKPMTNGILFSLSWPCNFSKDNTANKCADIYNWMCFLQREHLLLSRSRRVVRAVLNRPEALRKNVTLLSLYSRANRKKQKRHKGNSLSFCDLIRHHWIGKL